MNNNTIESQKVLFPKTIDLSPDDYDSLVNLLPYINKIGFNLREFGENKIIIDEVPVYMKNDDELSIIKYIIDNNEEYGTKETEAFDKIAANYSCKAAIKAGDKLELKEMKHLVN